MAEKMIFHVAYQPQVRTRRDTRSLMLDVLIALLPAIAVAIIRFGWYQLLLVSVSVASAVFFEWAYRRLLNKRSSVGDLSAAVTGMLLGMVLPCGCPWWIPVVGNLFAIVVVKQLYGGIGKNFLNPALAGRAFLLASYPAILATWEKGNIFDVWADAVSAATAQVDAVTMATPLSYLYNGEEMPAFFSVKAFFIGTVPGCIGELSAIAILAGFAYLLIRRVITWRIPVSVVGTVGLLCLVFGHSGYGNLEWAVYNVLSGGLLFAAVFMATDYATSPVTAGGQILYGVGCGILTVLIRYFGGYPEGCSYAILIMNLCTWTIDKAFRRHQFGINPKNDAMLSKAERYEERARKLREKAAGGYSK